jgi:hypothetical protein
MISYLSLTDSPYGQIGFSADRQIAMTEARIYYSTSNRSLDRMLHLWQKIISRPNASAKPFGEVCILMFDMGQNPPSKGRKTQ